MTVTTGGPRDRADVRTSASSPAASDGRADLFPRYPGLTPQVLLAPQESGIRPGPEQRDFFSPADDHTSHDATGPRPAAPAEVVDLFEPGKPRPRERPERLDRLETLTTEHRKRRAVHFRARWLQAEQDADRLTRELGFGSAWEHPEHGVTRCVSRRVVRTGADEIELPTEVRWVLEGIEGEWTHAELREWGWRPVTSAEQEVMRGALERALEARDFDAARAVAFELTGSHDHWTTRELRKLAEDPDGIAHGAVLRLLSRGRWNAQRSRGQHRRFASIRQCASEWCSVGTCSSGHASKPRMLGCGVRRACVFCRGREANHLRKKVDALCEMYRHPRRTANELRKAHRFEGVEDIPHAFLARLDAGASAPSSDRWSPKFLTLTAPDSGSLVADVESEVDAWTDFTRRISAYLEKDRGHDKSATPVRVIEVTPGRSQQGHAHIHALCWWPFVDLAIVRHEWGRALDARGYSVPSYEIAWKCDTCGDAPIGDQRLRPLPTCHCGGTQVVADFVDAPADLRRGLDVARGRELARVLRTRRGPHGRLLERILWPVCDIRSAGADVAVELVKYLVKDAEQDDDGKWRLVDVEKLADAYVALEGRRTMTAPRGAWLAGELCRLLGGLVPCEHEGCGLPLTFNVERRRRASGVVARGPPGQCPAHPHRARSGARSRARATGASVRNASSQLG